MRITIVAPGSRGDIQPYVALGTGLTRQGHEVTILTNEEFDPLVRSYGLECVTVPVSVREALQEQSTSAALESGSTLASFARLAGIARRAGTLLAEKGMAACRGADALVAGLNGLLIGHSLCEKFGIRLVQAYNVPITPTGEFEGALVPVPPFFPRRAGNLLSHRLARQILWQAARTAGARARKEVLGLPPAPLFGPFAGRLMRRGPVLYGWSPRVIPRPAEWGPEIELTGYWFLNEPEGWRPPDALRAFVDKGPSPVSIGFGSMSARDAAHTFGIVLGALRRTAHRAILLSGWSGLRGMDIPPNVFLTEGVPHSWLFPRMAAVVHHGGAGTTAAGIRAGVPSVLVPHHGDQPFWGRRIAALGAGPRPLPRQGLRAEALARAIDEAVGDPGLRRRAAELGAAVRSEDGVGVAARLITRALEAEQG